MIKKIRIISDSKVVEEKTFEDPATVGSSRVNTSQITNNSAIIELIDVYGYKYSQTI